MKLKKFLKKHSHNNLIRLYFKSKDGSLTSVLPEKAPYDVSMDHEIIEGKGIHKAFRNRKVVGLASIYHPPSESRYSEAISIVIKEHVIDSPFPINYDWLAAITRSYDLHYKDMKDVFARYKTDTTADEYPNEKKTPREPWGFCETPEEQCTANYCDDNGCQNRKRETVNDKPEPPLKEHPISTLEFAMDALKQALKEDPYYRETWVANISMAFKDAYQEFVVGKFDIVDTQNIATKAANNFINQLTK